MPVSAVAAARPLVSPALDPTPYIAKSRAERVLAKRPAFDAEYWKIIGQCARRAPAVAYGSEYLRDHDKAWKARQALVASAQHEIVCSLYCIEPDEYGIAYLDALIAAQNRGVQVALGVDTLAQRFVRKGADKEKLDALDARFGALEAAGATVRKLASLDQQTRLPGSGVHTKMLVVDGARAIAGGRNVGGNYYGHLFRDFEMRLDGPIARQLRGDVLTALNRAGDTVRLPEPPPLPFAEPRALYHVVTWDPLHDGGEIMREKNRITQALLVSLQRARREITLTSNYVVGHPQLRQALMDAAALGVKVRIITTGESASHVSKMAWRSTRPGYDELARAGVEVYETEDTPDHAKIFVIDDVAAFGSYNFSDYSDGRLAETLIFTGDKRDVGYMRELLENSVARSKRYDPDAPREKLRLGERFLRWVGSLVYAFRAAQ